MKMEDIKAAIVKYVRNTPHDYEGEGLTRNEAMRRVKTLVDSCDGKRENGEHLLSLVEATNNPVDLFWAIFTFGMKCESDTNLFNSVVDFVCNRDQYSPEEIEVIEATLNYKK